MADEKLVKREMLTASFLNGTDVKRGDVVELTEAQAKAWEDADPPAVAEVGYLANQEKERQQAEQAAVEAAEQARQAEADQARLRGLHAQGKTAGDDKAEAEEKPVTRRESPRRG